MNTYKTMRFIMIVCAAFLPAITTDAQTTWYVAANGTGQGTGGWADATDSLPGAISAADAGDTVLVSNGIYQLSGQLSVSKAVIVQSLNGREETTIRGDYPDTVFRCLSISSSGAIVDGFTIANGYETNAVPGGAGVYIAAGTLRNCRVTGNCLQTPPTNTQRGGAGIFMVGSTVVSNCLIDANVLTNESSHAAAGGGGVHMSSVDAWLIDSVIYNNLSTNVTTGSRGKGGGIMSRNGNITGCLIVSNSASGSGGGVCMAYGKTLVSGGTNAYNFTLIYGGGLCVPSGTQPAPFSNIVFRGNTARKAAGAMFLAEPCIFYNCMFEDNQTLTEYGGAGFIQSSVSFYNCRFCGNQAAAYGGAIWWDDKSTGTGIISRCVFETNMLTGSKQYGGALALYGGALMVENSIIRGHHLTADYWVYGAGVYLASSGGVTLRNCLIYDNSAVGASTTYGGRGGGLYISASKANLIESCTMVSNYANRYGGGIYLDGAGNDRVRNSVVDLNFNQSGADNWHFGNYPDRKTDVTYTCTPDADGTWGAGCIRAGPLFADPVSGDYRLRAGSPGINAGTNMLWMSESGAVDLDGNPRIDRFSRQVDMGCYERLYRGVLFYVR